MEMQAKLSFFCGKMAAGKSTLARALAQRDDAVLLVQDELLTKLFPGEIKSIPDFVERSARLRDALAPHIRSLLSRDISVVLDFPGNTITQRAWFRRLFEGIIVKHELHFVDATDEVCKAQLKERSANLPEGSAFTTEAEFDDITEYFQPPSDGEGFNVIRHVRP
jgi:predicted kinase